LAIPRIWIAWLRNYAKTATRFTVEEPVQVSTEEERELVAIKAALFARALTLFEGAVLLIENDRQLDFRIQSRGVIEAVMYLIALDRNPAFISKMKDDDYKSRQSRATLHLKAFNGTDDDRSLLEEFVALGFQGAKAIQIGALLEGSEFERLYRSYRDISGDAAHASLTSLSRHYIENPSNHSALLVVHPTLEDAEIHTTVTELGISMVIATLLVMKVKTKTDLWDEFQTLLQRYNTLAAEAR
jgi:hypothetical protein